MTANDNKYFLDKKREDALKNLGFLGFNLFVDKKLNFSEMASVVSEIKEAMARIQTFRQSEVHAAGLKVQEQVLNDKIMELGFMCYNFYIDKKIFNDEMLTVCGEIDALNNEAMSEDSNGAPVDEIPDINIIPEESAPEVSYEEAPLAGICHIPAPEKEEAPAQDYGAANDAFANPPLMGMPVPPVYEQNNTTATESVENWGAVMNDDNGGMEPIPEDFKRCMCGYKNKSYANFCGKCGARLV